MTDTLPKKWDDLTAIEKLTSYGLSRANVRLTREFVEELLAEIDELKRGQRVAEPDDLAADAILEQARELQALANRIYAHATARLRASRRLTVLTGLFLLAAIAALIGGWP